MLDAVRCRREEAHLQAGDQMREYRDGELKEALEAVRCAMCLIRKAKYALDVKQNLTRPHIHSLLNHAHLVCQYIKRDIGSVP